MGAKQGCVRFGYLVSPPSTLSRPLLLPPYLCSSLSLFFPLFSPSAIRYTLLSLRFLFPSHSSELPVHSYVYNFLSPSFSLFCSQQGLAPQSADSVRSQKLNPSETLVPPARVDPLYIPPASPLSFLLAFYSFSHLHSPVAPAERTELVHPPLLCCCMPCFLLSLSLAPATRATCSLSLSSSYSVYRLDTCRFFNQGSAQYLGCHNLPVAQRSLLLSSLLSRTPWPPSPIACFFPSFYRPTSAPTPSLVPSRPPPPPPPPRQTHPRGPLSFFLTFAHTDPPSLLSFILFSRPPLFLFPQRNASHTIFHPPPPISLLHSRYKTRPSPLYVILLEQQSSFERFVLSFDASFGEKTGR